MGLVLFLSEGDLALKDGNNCLCFSITVPVRWPKQVLQSYFYFMILVLTARMSYRGRRLKVRFWGE